MRFYLLPIALHLCQKEMDYKKFPKIDLWRLLRILVALGNSARFAKARQWKTHSPRICSNEFIKVDYFSQSFKSKILLVIIEPGYFWIDAFPT